MAPIRLATWPPPGEFGRNPYLVAFYDAVKQYDVVPVTGLSPTVEWLRANRASIDALHIHWPDGLWRRRTRGSIRAQLRKTLELRRFLKAARNSGLKIVWTLHNFAAHQGATWLDRYCYRVLAAHVDLLICHSRWSAGVAARRYSVEGRAVVVPCGSFPGVYPEPRPRDVVLRELGLRVDRPTICAVGNIRVYKGLDIAVDAVRRLDGAVQLIIGGRPSGRRIDIQTLRESLARVSGGMVLDRVLDNQEFSDIVGASEAVLLPYTNITTSAVLLTAWTLGRGVIASDLPYFREIAGDDLDAARLFPPGDAGALSDVIKAYLQVPAEQRSAAAGGRAALYSWDRCVEPLGEIIGAWRGHRKSE
jgi:glycosyltransferase involved in cell wall biosynthesis